jgi:hypothetical protein
MRALALCGILAMGAACRPIVLSSYGALCAVRRGDDGTCRPRAFPHDGADFGPAEIGAPVIASADGVVLQVVESAGYGVEVVVLHDASARYRTGYMHLRSAAVRCRARSAASIPLATTRRVRSTSPIRWRAD